MTWRKTLDPNEYLGHFLDSSFFLDRLIGRGAFASVFHAQCPDQSEVAVKMLHTAEPLAHLRFIREIKVMRALPPSAHLVRYLGHGTLPSGGAYLAMEYVPGKTLRSQMKLAPVSSDEAAFLGYQICLSLHPLHRYGIVHRDLKPSNVLWAPDGTVKLFDFGLVLDSEGMLKLFEEEDFLQGRAFATDVEKGVVVGTPEYMGLEQFFDAPIADPRARKTCPASDVFSVGVIMYRLCTGRFPYPLKTVGRKPTKQEFVSFFRWRQAAGNQSIRRPENMDDALWSIVLRALSDPVEVRQPDSRALADDLYGYLTGGQGTRREEGSATVLSGPRTDGGTTGRHLPLEAVGQGADPEKTQKMLTRSSRRHRPVPQHPVEAGDADVTQRLNAQELVFLSSSSSAPPHPPLARSRGGQR